MRKLKEVCSQVNVYSIERVGEVEKGFLEPTTSPDLDVTDLGAETELKVTELTELIEYN